MGWTPFTRRRETSATRARKELRRLLQLQERYALQRDIFSQSELGRLHFIWWLVRTGRIQPG
ncbi:MAG TPA: hypothetical protein VKX16_12925 [Chloroflexota bacterium]|nr:hypothetical protein [Chloroflexota bacterium]